MDEARYQMQRSGWHPNPQWMVTTDEIKEMWPFIKTDDVLGGLFNPGTEHRLIRNISIYKFFDIGDHLSI